MISSSDSTLTQTHTLLIPAARYQAKRDSTLRQPNPDTSLKMPGTSAVSGTTEQMARSHSWPPNMKCKKASIISLVNVSLCPPKTLTSLKSLQSLQCNIISVEYTVCCIFNSVPKITMYSTSHWNSSIRILLPCVLLLRATNQLVLCSRESNLPCN